MIGVLCSNENEEIFSEKLYSLFKDIKNGNDESIIVFSISNIDFLKKMVKGSLISWKVIKSVSVTLPSVIFNFSVQLKSECIKARKLLEDMEGVELVNNVNRFDQSMIMEILSVSEETIKYLLPHSIYDNNIEDFKLDEKKEYMCMPLKGTSISSVLYKRPEIESDKSIDTFYIEKGHIHGLIKAALFQKKRILIEIPKLVTNNDQPIITRIYMQRIYGKNWRVLGSSSFPENDISKNILLEKANETALNSISYINNYMPSLGECFIDLLLGNDGSVYFLRLGGIVESFFELKQDKDFYMIFYKNLIKLANYLNYM